MVSNIEQITRKIIDYETMNYVANITKHYSVSRRAFGDHIGDPSGQRLDLF
ncbi:hypothetical protein [Kiloniella sp. EL199]|uniref:hypothetical protein n=1 Tax=Kiloniella sp. EL199 TaxID=2107581 RepID=UPI0013C50705|nr:hypothetical protein [Kiloniella sp. EL199]